MLLSVISAFARLDIDPWQEATSLAKLPEKAATERLKSLIAALPEGPSARQTPGTIAERLVPLLPCRRVSPSLASGAMQSGADDATKFRTGVYVVVAFYIVALGAQWIVGIQQPPAHQDDAATPASIEAPQSPANYGQ
jgi:hypothetical protein